MVVVDGVLHFLVFAIQTKFNARPYQSMAWHVFFSETFILVYY